MKIYTYLHMDIDGTVLEECSYEYDGRVSLCKGGKVKVPPPTSTEIELQKEMLADLQSNRQLREQLLPYVLETAGYTVDENDNIVRMPYEQYLEQLDPLMRQQYENMQLISEHAAQALRGELPVSPALEQNIQSQKQQLEENLARRLGVNWSQSTAGIQAKQAFEQSAEALREQARRGALQTYSGLGYQGSLGVAPSVSNVGAQLGIGGSRMNEYQAALAPFQQQRQWQMQAAMANAQKKSQQQAALWGGLGTIAGMALGGPMGAAIGGTLGTAASTVA